MTTNQPRSGYTLPVFACAAAVAALEYLKNINLSIEQISIDLIDPVETANIPIEQIAILTDNSALAITRSDPGDNLDLTRNTPIWAMVEWLDSSSEPLPYQQGARGDQLSDTIFIKGGEGIGYDQKTGQTAIYRYAKTLLLANIEKILPPNKSILITFILPQGKRLATRTSNAAFGIVEGLSLLGTTGISQPLTVPEQLEQYKIQLQEKAKKFDSLVFCIGENGLELAARMGISPQQMIKTANWLGPMLVCAALAEVKSILLFGYHGKLIKLAGGIFHTHHHIADGRLEILTAYCANLGLSTFDLQRIFNCSTAEDALQYLRELDAIKGENWVIRVYGEIAKTIDQRSQNYIYTHCEKNIKVGSVMFDRQRKIIIKSENAGIILE
ncbi:MAG: cobalt-precorrin-5B (C(1))-methyltransferase CbiD [Planktothrix sp. GU0601_MAG3]|nr:MAG: cobalt-precorrin-5B (C(1))-methyltransferase CbiD [Planktothrix sp. GU0601_MAG3]